MKKKLLQNKSPFFAFAKEKQHKTNSFPRIAFLALCLVFICSSKVSAQVASYTFAQASGTYTALTTPTTVHTAGWDDNVASVTIPFSFTFNGTAYTSCDVSSNGFITFGGTAPGTTAFTPISGTTAYNSAISALGRDLINNGVVISTKTLGTTPNRTFVVEWNNARRYDSGAQTGNFNFQIILLETSNIIKVVYGACTSSYATDLPTQVGLRGTSNADYNNRTTTNNWPASTAGGTNAATCNTGNGGGELPTTGLTYTWTPPAPPISNDTCATATSLTPNSSCTPITGSTVGATDNNETGDCSQGTAEKGIWYKFTATATTATVTVDGAAGQDMVVGAINACGSATPPTGGSCVDATVSDGIETLNLTGLTIGLTYYIQVYEWYGVESATAFTICVTSTVAAVPTITGLGSANGCVGSSLIITGTNFTGASAVTIGSTAVTSYTVNSPTQITAVVASGTTGTVAVTTAGGTATSGATFTVNPLPANPGNPTSNSPQCATPGVTLTRVGSPPGGETWYWQTTSLGTSTTNSGNTFNVTSSSTYYIRAQNNTTGCWSSGQGSLAVTINPLLSVIAATPSPTNAATGVCASGTGSISAVTWAATAGATNYDVYFGAGSLPGSVTSNVATNSYTTGALLTGTTYYWKIVPKNACGATTGTPATWTFTTLSTPCYCTSTGGTMSDGITGVVFNTINNTGTAVNVAYSNYTAITTTVTKGNSYNLSAYVNTAGNYTNYQSAWIDWNGNGLFTDSGEFYNLGTAKNVTSGLSSLCPYPIPVPLAAITGAVRMRIQSKYDTPTTGSCETAFDGEVEDYTINIISDPAACATPTAQATALVLSPNGTSVSGSFTAASPVPNRYLVIISASAVAPAPINGTVYAVGGTVGAGYTVVDTDSNTTFLANGLTANTNYYFYVFAFNGICTGGPLYNTTAPLNGSATTLNNIYCTPSSVRSGDYIAGIASVGTLNDISNAPTGYSPNGYANYTGITIASQIPAGGINIDIHLTGSQFIRAYVDWNNDGDFIDVGEEVYTTGTTATGDTSFGFIVPGAQAPGNYRMRIRTKSFNENSTIDPCTTGFLTGETEDYTINIQADCLQKITSWTDGEACGPTNTVNLTAVSAGATGFRWYAAETGGTPIGGDVIGTGNWTTPSIGTTTIYYVTAYNGTCESLYRVPVVATIKTTTNIMVTPSVPSVCGEGNVVEISANGDVVVEDVLVQNFESGLGSFTITTPTNTNGGADSPWSIKTSPYQPTTTSVWKPAINSSAAATIGNQFAFTTSDYSNSNIETRLTTPVINASIYTSLTLTFDHYYSYYGGDSGSIEVSIDGGTTWITPALAVYNSDLGSASKFINATVDFSAYAGQSNLQFRFTYKGSWDDGWAIDNINLVGTRPLNTTFTWSGGVDAFTDAACTIPYVAQLVTTIYVKPTGAQINAATWSFTASTTLGNGCPVSKFITITNNTKTWQGTSTNWNDANNWMPVGVPDINTCVIIPSSVNQSVLSAGLAGNGKNLIVKSGGILELQSGNSLTIKEGVDVNAGGTFNIQNNSSLVQIDNVANTGNISMKRDANIRKLDYVYWSSPVANFASSAVSSGTSTGYIYKWLPTTVSGNTSNFGNWAGGSETMVTGKGYIVRGPNNFTATPQIFTANFAGVPNNGNITTPIARSTYDGVPYAGPTTTPVTADDDNWNLIGNPYPSAIDALSFLSVNTNVAGFVKIWSHGTIPLSGIADPFYEDYVYNYSLTDYITYNNLGASSSPQFTGKIGAGQGFFVLMNHSSISPNENAVFDNSMRDHTYRNDQFFRTNEAASPSITERNRIWLDLIAPDGKTSRTLVGYATGATNILDRPFDAIAMGIKTNFELYTLAENKGLCIQGRSLPFDENDTIPMGVSIPQNGIYTIAIASVDGLFANSNQNIFLEDQLLGIVHDLRTAPYSFTANTGTFENRFVLRYTSGTLGTDNFTLTHSVKVVTNEKVTVHAANQIIKEILVFDLLGRKIDSYKNVNAAQFTLNHLSKTMTTLILKITLENDVEVTEKIIF